MLPNPRWISVTEIQPGIGCNCEQIIGLTSAKKFIAWFAVVDDRWFFIKTRAPVQIFNSRTIERVDKYMVVFWNGKKLCSTDGNLR